MKIESLTVKKRNINHRSNKPEYGTTQYNRLIAELLPTYLRIDDKDIAQLLAYTAEYARHIHFYNEENEIDGNWEDFFTADISIILAQIIATNLTLVNQNFKQKYQQVRLAYFQETELVTDDFPDKFAALQALFDMPYQLALQFNKWILQIQRIQQSEKGELELIVEEKLLWLVQSRLSKALQQLIAYADAAKAQLGKPIILQDTPTFNSIWALEKVDLSDPKNNIFKPSKNRKNKNEKINNAIFYIEQVFKVFYDGLCYVVNDFKQYFEKSLLYKSNHKPNVGLYIAFLQLYKHSQEDLNELSNEILLFYYQKVLKQELRLGSPDNAFIAFKLASHVNEHFLPIGTQLRARLNQQTILYEVIEDVELNKSKVALLKTLFLNKNLKKTITSEYEVVTDIYAAPVANSKDGRGADFDLEGTPWPTFGEEQTDKSIYFQNMVREEVGFAIASPILEMKEGERKVELTLQLKTESTQILERLVTDIKEKFDYQSSQEAFFRIFSPFGKGNLSIFYSSNQARDGWVEVKTVNLSLPNKTIWPPESLQLTFDIDIAQPSVSPYSRDSRYAKFYNAQGLPLIKVILNDFTEPYAYSFLKHLQVEKIDINIEVNRIRSFRVYNELGEININQPFQLFGPSPVIESYLLIGNKELFQKELSSLDIQFTWQNLPETRGDAFDIYFKDYGLKHDAYRVRVAALSDSEFYPEEETEILTFPLFTPILEEDGSKGDMSVTKFNFSEKALKYLDIVLYPEVEELEDFDNNTQSGYLKIELSAPDKAFGHELYQDIVMQSTMKNTSIMSRFANKEKDQQEQLILDSPSRPYTPFIKSLSMSYKASATINLGHPESVEFPQKMFHVYPFGTDMIYPNLTQNIYRTNLEAANLLPTFDADGYLFIGIKDIKPNQTLSLLFEMVAQNFRYLEENKNLPEIEWAYLSNHNQWKDLSGTYLLSDTTDQFTDTGIIKIRVPLDFSSRSTILPEGYLWLQLAVKGEVELLNHTIDIRTQAVLVERKSSYQATDLHPTIPPNSIKNMHIRNNAIREVIQPFPSFGGRLPENNQDFLIRVSERLRHRERAINTWDIERLVIANFYDVFQIKCFSHLSHPHSDEEIPTKEQFQVLKREGIKKGEGMVIVVAPFINYYNIQILPAFGIKRLGQIRSFIRKHTSAFLKIKVRNPDYEYIRVTAKVKFTNNEKSGQLLEKLNKNIAQYVAPWKYRRNTPLTFGQTISENAFLNHLKALPYVKFVTAFSVLHIIEEYNGRYQLIDTAEEKGRASTLHTSKPWSLFVADLQHNITVTRSEEREELPRPVKRPVPFKNKQDIYERATFIKITLKKKEAQVKTKEEGTEKYFVEFDL